MTEVAKKIWGWKAQDLNRLGRSFLRVGNGQRQSDDNSGAFAFVSEASVIDTKDVTEETVGVTPK